MARLAPRVPEMTDVLCEGCGYVLNGLPTDGRCPECGKPIAESVGAGRWSPLWEAGNTRAMGFVRTSLEVIFRPTHFYRTLAVRGSVRAARGFARIHWWIAAGLFGVTAATHSFWYWYSIVAGSSWFNAGRSGMLYLLMILPLTVLTYFALDGITRLAARLTNWEATYRGIRLPYDIVLRGMYYHAAHYLPVAVAAAVTVLGYQLLLAEGVVSWATADRYLYVLSGLVILSAAYLFHTYWIGMRNMMYANR